MITASKLEYSLNPIFGDAVLNKLHYQWPVKLILAIIITQVIVLGHFGNLQINVGSVEKYSTANILTPCPKAEILSKVTQQLCQNQLNLSLNSIITVTIFFTLPSIFVALMNHVMRYKMLVYSIFKPPKSRFSY